jgi:type I restriction enzyme, S subunit
MSKGANIAAVPTLRFPEFNHVWNKCTLFDVAVDGFSNGVFNDPKKVGSGYKLINVSDMYLEMPIDENRLSLVAINETEFLRNKVEPGDIFFTRSSLVPAGIAESNIYLGTSNDVTFDGHLIRLRPQTTTVAAVFLHYLLKTQWVRTQLIAKGKVATMTTIGKSDVASTRIMFPAKPEQLKIAGCLSSLDELITTESQKLDALKAHRKGLMQQLFPAVGETAPRYRFAEFKERWQEKVVDDFFDVASSKRVLEESWTEKGVPFYRTRELVSLAKNEPFGSEVFISKELFLELSKRYGVPKQGDFLVSGVGTLGICYQVKQGDTFYFKDGNVLWFKLKSGIDSNYFKYCFQADHIQDQIFGQASVSTVGTYTIQNARKTKLWYPTDRREQQKIAECLSSLDNLIITQSGKLEALKVHKKGLMQQLFPQMFESTSDQKASIK